MEGLELIEGEVFKQIIGFDNFYISNKGRCWNSKTKHFLGTYNQGYIQVHLRQDGNEITTRIHQLVMQYFGTPKPIGDYEIDHINHKRDDNRAENLRWCSRTENNKNRTGANHVVYELFDEIPADEDDIIEVRDYGNHEFENLYFADNYFYLYTGINYRRMHINFKKTGSAFIQTYDTNNKLTSIAYTRFKKLYGLI